MHSFQGSRPGLPQPLHEGQQPLHEGQQPTPKPGHARIVSYDRVWRARDEKHGPGSSRVSATSSAAQNLSIYHVSEHTRAESPPSVSGPGRGASPIEGHLNVQLLDSPACQDVDLSGSAQNAAMRGDEGVWTIDNLKEENRRLKLVIEREREALAREEGVNAGMRVRNKELDLDRCPAAPQ